MRRKWRVVVCLTVIFILFVSYKILEPDIKGGTNHAELEYREVPVAREDNSRVNANEDHEGHQNVDDIVKELQKKYWINFNYPLKESPWQVAEKMVNLREVHPEQAPEIGEINTLAVLIGILL